MWLNAQLQMIYIGILPAPISEFFDPKGNLNTIYETESL